MITDIPYSNSGLKPRRIRTFLSAPSTPAILELKLHVVSDTYMSVDWESELILNVSARQDKVGFKAILDDDSSSLSIHKDMVKGALNQLPACVSEEEIEAEFAVIITKYQIHKMRKTKESDTDPGDNQADTIDDLSLNHIKVSATREAHYLYQRLYSRKPVLSDKLERLIPDTLNAARIWNKMSSCHPEKDYISERMLKWDCWDDNDEDWVDLSGKFTKDELRLFNESRIILGREIGGSTTWLGTA